VSRPPAPATLRWAIALVVLETVLVWGYVAFLGYESAVTHARGGGLVTGYFAAYAVAFAGLAWALARRKSWARGPVILLQLFLLAIGYYMIRGGLAPVGIAVLLLAVTCIGLLLAPTTREALGVRAVRG
jgi:hypothetical protein